MIRLLWRSFSMTLVVTLAILLSSSLAQAQATRGELRGKITDAQTGQPLPGGQVLLRGTTFGTAANLDGEYLVRAIPPGKYIAQARFVGYLTVAQEVEITAGETKTLDFKLFVTAVQIDEIVVTGTALEAERRTLGNTISTINTRELGQVPVVSLAQVLQGRIPGVVALLSSGQVGAGASLRIRGMTSITQSNEPIVYIDGVRVDNFNGETFYTTGGQRPSRLNDITPSDIERVEIIKGASATTLYGTQASAGVIQIFTKRGSVGSPQVNFHYEQGWITLPKIDVGQIVVTQGLLDSLQRKNVDLSQLPNLQIGADAVNSFRKTGPYQAYETSVRGGIEGARYYVSGRYENQVGALPQNASRRYNFRGNVDADVLENLKLSATSSYVNYFLQRPNDDNNIYGFMGNSLLANVYNARVGRPWGEPFTALNLATQLESNQKVDRFTGGITFEYRPLSLWTHRLTAGTDVVAEENTQFFPYGQGFSNVPDGQKTNNRRTASRISLDYATSYKTDLIEDINGSFTAGGQLFFESDFQATAQGTSFPAPGVSTVSAAATRLGFESRVKAVNGGYFGQAQFGWKERLFLTFGSRFDRNSTFGKQFGTQVYPKAGVSYLISEESFWPKDLLWNSLKLRAAYGTSGKQPTTYSAERSWAATAGLNGTPAVTPNNLGDPTLKPELSQELELGFDAGFWDSRIGLEVTYFSQRTKDALVNVPSTPSLGFLNAQLRNVGEVRNNGIEIGLRTIPIRTEDINVTFNVTYARHTNEVTDMGGSADIPFGLGGIGLIKKGYAISSFFGQKITDVKTFPNYTASTLTRYGSPVVDSTLNSVTGKMDAVVSFLGQTIPKQTGSISAGITLFNNLSISASADWAVGHVIYNDTQGFAAQASFNTYEPMRVIRARLNDPNFNGPEREQLQRQYQSMNPSYAAQFVEKGDFLKFRELAITYTLPTSWIRDLKLRSTSITFSGRNLATWTNYSGADPEISYAGQQDISRGQDFLTVPQNRLFIFTINAGF